MSDEESSKENDSKNDIKEVSKSKKIEEKPPFNSLGNGSDKENVGDKKTLKESQSQKKKTKN